MSQSKDVSASYVVVAGVDFSQASGLALEESARLVQRTTKSSLHIVHVIPVSVGEPAIGAVPELAYNDQIHRAAKVLERWIAPYREQCRTVTSHIRIGRPDLEIAQLASDVAADLVVVGTQGRKGLARLMLGSVAESVVRHAPCPVLVYRPREAPAWEQIVPPCEDCLAVQKQTGMAKLWCERHSEHHPRGHTYHEVPEGFGVGAQTFRFGG